MIGRFANIKFTERKTPMNIDFDRAQLRLKAREVIRLYDPRGARVECVRGALWITQNRDHEDYFLAANDALTLDRPGLALIHAQAPSEVVLSEPAPRPRLRQKIARVLVAALRAAGRGSARQFGPESIDRHRRSGCYHGL
jgi:hypothetical protein